MLRSLARLWHRLRRKKCSSGWTWSWSTRVLLVPAPAGHPLKARSAVCRVLTRRGCKPFVIPLSSRAGVPAPSRN